MPLPNLKIYFISTNASRTTSAFAVQKKQVPFSMAVEKVKPMHECFPEYLHMEISWLKSNKQTE